MDREQLEGAQATLRGLRDTLATGAENPPDANYDRLAGAIDAVAGVVTALVEAELVKTEHANAVAEEIKRPRTLDHGHGAVKGGPGWPEVERADRSDKFHDPEEITGHGRY